MPGFVHRVGTHMHARTHTHVHTRTYTHTHTHTLTHTLACTHTHTYRQLVLCVDTEKVAFFKFYFVCLFVAECQCVPVYLVNIEC